MHIYFNPDSKKWYTTTRTNKEAMDFSCLIMDQYSISCTVISGDKHFKTGKPAYYTVELERNPNEVKS